MSVVPPSLVDCSIAEIASVIQRHTADTEPSDLCPRKAAVAMILRDNGGDVETLFIKRAYHPEDPWSGHMAFPGGRQDPIDDTVEAAARRETFEEVGILLTPGMLIGRLDDLIGGRLAEHHLSVSPYIYHGPKDAHLVLNYEVAAAVWVPVAYLADRANVGEYTYPPDPMQRAFPCFHYDGYTVWGLTYRIVADFVRKFDVHLPLELPVTDVE